MFCRAYVLLNMTSNIGHDPCPTKTPVHVTGVFVSVWPQLFGANDLVGSDQGQRAVVALASNSAAPDEFGG